MRSQLDDETDEEYLDDPIKLFDLEHDRVHFGSQQYGFVRNNEFPQSINNEETRECEVLNSSDEEIEDFSHIEPVPVSVKLVDCKKFPWYFKKYAEQLIDADIYDLVSDSDNEIDENKNRIVEDYSNDKGDCMFNDMADSGNVSLSATSSKDIVETKYLKRQENLKQRDDFELQLALSRKSVDIIDFKRNKGLVGMTITPKTVTDVYVYHKTNVRNVRISGNELVVNKSYLQAANKTLSRCGTELIPISENADNYVVKIHNKYKFSPATDTKTKAKKFNEKLLYHKITKKIVKEKNNVLHNRINKQKLPKCKKQNISKQVINIKNTNKYKKRQIKNKDKTLLRDQSTELNEDKIVIDNKKATDDSEPRSPILPCSTLRKSKDFGDISLKDDRSNAKTVMNIINSINKHKENKTSTEIVIGKTIKNKEFNQLIQDKNTLAPAVLENDSQTNSVIQHENIEIKEEVMDTENNHTVCDPTNDESPYNNHKITEPLENLPAILDDSSNNMKLQIVSVTSLANRSQSNDETDIDKTQQTPALEAVQSKRISVISNPDRPVQFNSDCNLKLSVRNNSTNKSSCPNSSSNIPNNNHTLVHHAYASSIILRPNQANNCQTTPFNEPVPHGQSPLRMPPRVQQRPFLNNYPPNFQKSTSYFGFSQRYMPRYTNPACPGFRFPSPPGNGCQPRCTPPQIPNFAWQNPNMYNKRPPRAERPHKINPCNFAVSISQNLKNGFNTDCNGVPQPNNMLPPKNIPPPVHIPPPVNIRLQGNIRPPVNIQPQVNVRPSVNMRPTFNMRPPVNVQPPVNSPPPVNNPPLVNIPLPANMPPSDRCLETDSNQNSALKNLLDKPLLQLSAGQIMKTSNVVSEPNHDNVSTSKTVMAETSKKVGPKSATMLTNKEPSKAKEKLKLTVTPATTPNKNSRQQIEQEQGYSPPILPIPTYEKIMGRVVTALQKQDGLLTKTASNDKKEPAMGAKKPETCVKKVLSQKVNTKKEEARKISLEEYKKRTNKSNVKKDRNKKCKYNEYGQKQINQFRGNVDRFSTESDLGYDSDSTVIL